MLNHDKLHGLLCLINFYTYNLLFFAMHVIIWAAHHLCKALNTTLLSNFKVLHNSYKIGTRDLPNIPTHVHIRQTTCTCATTIIIVAAVAVS